MHKQQQRKCSVDACGREHVAKGMCAMHYGRVKRTGRTGPADRVFLPFWDYVDVGHPLGCWTWTGRVNASGYGRYGQHLAHRRAYVELIGVIPAGLTLDHLCRNRICVNPDHLEPVTMRENLLRGETFQGRNARKRSCVRGHPFTEANTYMSGAGYRSCRTCSAAASKRSHARRRALAVPR